MDVISVLTILLGNTIPRFVKSKKCLIQVPSESLHCLFSCQYNHNRMVYSNTQYKFVASVLTEFRKVNILLQYNYCYDQDRPCFYSDLLEQFGSIDGIIV